MEVEQIGCTQPRGPDHVVVGYRTTGRATVQAVLEAGVAPEDIVVVDMDATRLAAAGAVGPATVKGDATRTAVLREAGVAMATSVTVATGSDATTVLITLTARDIAPRCPIAAATGDAENAALLRRAGACVVVVVEQAAGQLLATAAARPEQHRMARPWLTRWWHENAGRALRSDWRMPRRR